MPMARSAPLPPVSLQLSVCVPVPVQARVRWPPRRRSSARRSRQMPASLLPREQASLLSGLQRPVLLSFLPRQFRAHHHLSRRALRWLLRQARLGWLPSLPESQLLVAAEVVSSSLGLAQPVSVAQAWPPGSSAGAQVFQPPERTPQ